MLHNSIEVRTKSSQEIPEIYFDLKSKFGVDWDKGIVIAYGDTIYSKDPIPDHLFVHEKTHITQQRKLGAREWYRRYITEDSFRLQQEIEAYQNQVRFIKINIRDREKKNKMVIKLAHDLSGKIYGNILSFDDALKIIQS